ncbi:hypothetical protein [Nocardia bovistercoris]|uniref:Tetratricopeptide repeat protein n=1 Tax=Nocardia bovistercoris TaxID=2785916 RepID=A0A931I8G6_9NOCA|nr:hypothetical protein [Nocardia bovistercoris]MBH0775300.1 hypothetical protein [Nocardia bovistercoris]
MALIGGQGTGKTHLALSFAQMRRNYRCICVLIGGTIGFDVQLGQLARLLRVTVDDGQSPSEAVREALAARDGWLLVFDNANRPQDVLDVLPASETGHVLVTSTNIEWRTHSTAFVEVQGFDGRKSADFLSAYGGLAAAQAANLTEIIGLVDPATAEISCLPIVLREVANAISSGQLTADQYTRRLARTSALVLSAKPTTYRDQVRIVWRAHIAGLAETSPRGLALLHFACFLAPQRLSYDDLRVADSTTEPLRTLLTDADERTDVASELKKFSFDFTDGHAIGLHQLLADVAREQMSDSQRRDWAEVSTAVIAASLPPSTDDRSARAVYDRLAPHVIATAQRSGIPYNDIAAESLRRLGVYFIENAEGRAAVDALDQAMRIVRPRNEHLAVRIAIEKADALRLSGQLDDTAVNFATETCERAVRILGDDDQDRWRTQADLGHLLCERGDGERGYPLVRQAAEGQLSRWIPPNRLGWMMIADLATLRFDLTNDPNDSVVLFGEPIQIEAIYRKVLAERLGELGGDHPDTLLARANLAWLLALRGDWRAADELIRAGIEAAPADHSRHLDLLAARVMVYRARVNDASLSGHWRRLRRALDIIRLNHIAGQVIQARTRRGIQARAAVLDLRLVVLSTYVEAGYARLAERASRRLMQEASEHWLAKGENRILLAYLAAEIDWQRARHDEAIRRMRTSVWEVTRIEPTTLMARQSTWKLSHWYREVGRFDEAAVVVTDGFRWLLDLPPETLPQATATARQEIQEFIESLHNATSSQG